MYASETEPGKSLEVRCAVSKPTIIENENRPEGVTFANCIADADIGKGQHAPGASGKLV